MLDLFLGVGEGGQYGGVLGSLATIEIRNAAMCVGSVKRKGVGGSREAVGWEWDGGRGSLCFGCTSNDPCSLNSRFDWLRHVECCSP